MSFGDIHYNSLAMVAAARWWAYPLYLWHPDIMKILSDLVLNRVFLEVCWVYFFFHKVELSS